MDRMRVEDVKVDLEELKKWKIQNAKERLEFIDFWVDYMKKNPDKKWSEQQKVLIDSQIEEELPSYDIKEFDKKTGEVVGYAIYNVKKHKSPRKNLQVDIPKSILSSMGAPV